MNQLEKRIENLEAIADPPELEPMIIYAHTTAEQCAEMNARRDPRNNPLMVEIRPSPEEAES